MNPPKTLEEAQSLIDGLPINRLFLGLRPYSAYPLDQHEVVAWELYERSFRSELPESDATTVIKLGLVYMHALHMAFARSLQPTGTPHPIAATVGAIRLGDEDSHIAKQFLAEVVLRSFQTGDSAMLNQIEKLAKCTLGKNRNFQVWVAIQDLLQGGAFQPSKRLSPIYRDLLEKPEIQVRWFPNTKEIKEHVARNRSESRFSDLAKLDDNGWTRVFKGSGASSFLEKGTRGKTAT